MVEREGLLCGSTQAQSIRGPEGMPGWVTQIFTLELFSPSWQATAEPRNTKALGLSRSEQPDFKDTFYRTAAGHIAAVSKCMRIRRPKVRFTVQFL